MRKLTTFIFLFLLSTVLAFSQNRLITGKIVDESGTPVSGASVLIKGTRIGSAADNDGVFRIQAKTGDVLVITGGIEPIEVTVGSDNNITIQAKRTFFSETEVVVTSAYSVKRTFRNVSTNTQVVTGEQLNTIRQTNVNNALAGKVSGMQVRSQSAAKLGNAGTGNIRLRGETGFGVGGDPIYVVDGTILPNINDINNDEIEDITVLQGPAASALFGPQGQRGAIVITMKKAKKGAKGWGVDLNLGTQIDRVYILPNYQNSYAGGNSADLIKYTWQPGHPELWKKLDGKYYHDYSDDASWGPRMVGQEYIPWYAWYSGHRYEGQTAKLLPQPNNARDFFNTGITFNNSIAVSKASDNVQLRMSFNNVEAQGILPSTYMKKNVFTAIGAIQLTPKVTASINFNYATQYLYGEFNDDYANQSTGSFNQWFHRNVDMKIMKELRGLRTPQGIWASWNKANPTAYNPQNERAFYAGNYWYNFYTWFDLVKQYANTDRFYGDITLAYQLHKNWKVRAIYRKQQNLRWAEAKYPSDLAESATQAAGPNCPECFGYYGTTNTNSNRTNMELHIDFNRKYNKFDVKAHAGTDIFRQLQKGLSANTNQGLSVPNLFSIANSKNPPTISNLRTDYRYSALFFNGEVSYDRFLNLEFTLRQDWMSDLPPQKSFIISKSAGFSFIFSDILKWKPLSFGKLRFSVGEIPTGIGVYEYPGFAYAPNQFQWNGNLLMTTPNRLVDPNIKGSVTRQMEFGLDVDFLRRRVGASVTYWVGDDRDFPFPVTLNGVSGFTEILTNTGLITKRGFNFRLTGRPVWTKNLKWEINANWGILAENKVKELYQRGTDTIKQTTARDAAWGTVGPYMIHKVGFDWGLLFGNGIKRINGQPVLDSRGFYVNDPAVNFGSVLPRHTFGLQSTLEYKRLIFAANADGQLGGKFFSLSDMWGSFSGLTARTAVLNDKGNPIRDPVRDGGGIHVFGVDNTGRPVDYYVEAQDYFHNLYNNRTFDPFVYDLTFIKIREVSLGYKLPVEKWGFTRKWVSRAEFSLVARSPLLLYADTEDFDPSEISNVSNERGNLPGTRGFGANLRISF
ncbi:MAG: SusC/RagA family TonB-linked outer membrane protein [Chitinophagaceae bacterium]|nr:SusC/RagA family TonB-linked outer membrane protein [Chitinophagaceae bacterium]